MGQHIIHEKKSEHRNFNFNQESPGSLNKATYLGIPKITLNIYFPQESPGTERGIHYKIYL